MRTSYVAGLLAAILITVASASHGQQSDSLKTYGNDGRLFSSGIDDYYLLSSKPAGDEDATGYVGQTRIVRHYAGGGYQIFIKNYSVWCHSFSRRLLIVWLIPGSDQSAESQYLDNPDRHPDASEKPTYNLYWAVCRGQFRKFQ